MDKNVGIQGGIDVTGSAGPLVVSQSASTRVCPSPQLMSLSLTTWRWCSLRFFFCYRPQWQGSDLINFQQAHLDELLPQHSCDHVVIVGDMNQHLIARSFEELLTVFGLTNHVFPTHISGSSLDPVISNLPETLLTRRPLSAWTQQTTLPS